MTTDTRISARVLAKMPLALEILTENEGERRGYGVVNALRRGW